jgi:hypothetical protein
MLNLVVSIGTVRLSKAKPSTLLVHREEQCNQSLSFVPESYYICYILQNLGQQNYINPLTPELNPSVQGCLLRYFTGDFNF